MTSLSDKLKALGVQLGARDLPPPRPRNPYTIEQIVPGRFQETPYGDAFVVETRYPPEHQHGRAGLCVTASLRTIAAWAGEARIAHLESGAFVFLDTETTGLAGGTGTYTFLVGVGRYEDGGFHLAQFFMRDPVEEPALLAALTEFLQPCDALVTFNGKAFDVPLLTARYVTNGEAFPLTSAAHLDLLPLARRLWRDRLPSRALGYLEAHILGVTRTSEDVPGWLIPSLYFDYLRSGDARPLKSVFYHNALDILSLAALLSHVAQLLDDPLNSAVEHGLDWIALGKLFEELGQIETAVQLYERGLEHDLPEGTYWETAQRLSFVHKRHDNLPAAVERWREAAGSGQIYAHVELAKFYEHRRRDYGEAAQWTRAALERVNAPDCPRSTRRQWLADLEHRLARLERKSGSSGGRVSNELKDRSRSQFGASAEAYATSDVHARGESLAILVELVKPQSSWQALDVATGAGHTALAFAPHVAHVIATDLTEEMLAKTAELAARRGLTNVETRLADAEALPFTDAAFDLVTCRLAFHHFPNPRLAISEFARVLKPGGVLGFSDNIVVPDERAANYYNAYEKLRDPSHHRVYSLVQLQAMFEEAGLSVEAVRQLSKEIEFHDWADRQHVSQTDKEKLLAMMRHIPAALKPLFAPRRADGTLYFSLWEVVMVGTSALR